MTAASELLSALRARSDPFAMVEAEIQAQGHTLRLIARPSWRWGMRWGYGDDGLYDEPTNRTLSGGLVLTLEGPRPVWGHAYFRYTKTARLRPKWSERQLYAAVGRLTEWAMKEAQRQDLVASVWRIEQQSNITDTMRDAIVAEEQRLGRDSGYDSMSPEDAQHWAAWLSQWLDHHPEDRKDAHAVPVSV